MFFIVGLGNPGDEYQKTRHSVGFMVIDALNKKIDLPPFQLNKKINAAISRGVVSDKDIIIIKPQTLMNNSGKAVKKLAANQRKDDLTIIVIHDDNDLSVGTLRICKNRGSAGHRGIESIINEMKTKDFIRIRIGIRRTETGRLSAGRNKNDLADFVLKPFNKTETPIINETINRAVSAVEIIIIHGINKAMGDFNNH